MSLRGTVRERDEYLALICPSEQASPSACAGMNLTAEPPVFTSSGASDQDIEEVHELITTGMLGKDADGRRSLKPMSVTVKHRPELGTCGGATAGPVDEEGLLTTRSGRTIHLSDDTPVVTRDGQVHERDAITEGSGRTVFGFVLREPAAACLVILGRDADDEGEAESATTVLRGDLVAVDTENSPQMEGGGSSQPVRLQDNGKLIISGQGRVVDGRLDSFESDAEQRVRLMVRGSKSPDYFEAEHIVAIIMDAHDQVLGSGRPEHAGPPRFSGRPDHAEPPDHAGRPELAGPHKRVSWNNEPRPASRPGLTMGRQRERLPMGFGALLSLGRLVQSGKTMIKPLAVLTAVLAISVTTVGCNSSSSGGGSGNDDSGGEGGSGGGSGSSVSAPDGSGEGFTDLQGTWRAGCHSFFGTHQIVTREVRGDEARQTVELYGESDPTCSGQKLRDDIQLLWRYEMGDEFTTDSGVSAHEIDIEILEDPAGVVERNKEFDIVRVILDGDDRAFFSEDAAGSSANRPTALNFEVPFLRLAD